MRRHIASRGAAGLAVVLGSALVAAGASGVASPRTAASAAPLDGRIAAADIETDQVVTLNPDGSVVVPVSPSGDVGVDPAWSPDGSTVAYAHLRAGADDFRITLVHGDGTGAHRLTRESRGSSDFSPTYTPDGRHVVYTRCRPDPPGGCAIYTVRADGTHRRALTAYGDRADFHPEVSPNGRRVAFTRFDYRGIQAQVWVMHLDGTHAHPVTRPRLEAGAPSWTFDGRFLVVTSLIDHVGENVYRIRADGARVTKLTHLAYPHNAEQATVSPSGDRILFSDDRNFPGIIGAELFVMRQDGSDQHAITHGGRLLAPAWGTAPPLPAAAAAGQQRAARAPSLTRRQVEGLPPVVARQLGRSASGSLAAR
jgi:TolB protein